MEVATLLTVMRTTLGQPMPEAFGGNGWRRREDLDWRCGGVVGELEVMGEVVTCILGNESGYVDTIIVDGSQRGVEADGQDDALSLRWDTAKPDVDIWAAKQKSETVSVVPFQAGWELTETREQGVCIHRVTRGTPPNNSDLPLTGTEATPFWSLIFFMGEAA